MGVSADAVVFPIDGQILLVGLLVLAATIGSKLSLSAGMPMLAVFVAIGMLLGDDGPGGIAFADYDVAHAIGTIALAVILFDGGLQTSARALRRVAVPAGLLATLGVAITAAVTGAIAAILLDLPLAYGLLLGSIVGSTDAAAVFMTLRSGGLYLQTRLSDTLEVESGANDPMAVLMTIACIEVVSGETKDLASVLAFLARQLGVGLVVGWAVSRVLAALINRISLTAEGLYPMLSLSAAFVAFGATALLGGSGFLAAYVCGIVIGNRRVVFERRIEAFHSGLAWLAQIGMFMVLGLLSSPSDLQRTWPTGLAVAAALMFVARPIAVVLCLGPFRYGWREIVFASWTGLRGAVPIILGIYPLLFGVAGAVRLFDIVFFVVLASVVMQGWSLRLLARRLGVTRTLPPRPPVDVEVTVHEDVDADAVSYLVDPDAAVVDARVRDLSAATRVVVSLIARGRDLVLPRGRTRIRVGDRVYVTLRPRARWLLDAAFAPERSLLARALSGIMTLGALEAEHGLDLPGDRDATLGTFLRARLRRAARRGDVVRFGIVGLEVLAVDDRGVPIEVAPTLVGDGERHPSGGVKANARPAPVMSE